MEIYKEIINMLEYLYNQNSVSYNTSTTDIPSTPGPPPKPQEGLPVSQMDIAELVIINLLS